MRRRESNRSDGRDEIEVKLPRVLPLTPKFPMEYKRIFFKECPVAGLSFHLEKNDDLWDELCEGTRLALIRDRKNKYDRNAVAVALADDYDGDPDTFDFNFILGYIPRTANAEIAAMMDAGYAEKFEAEISSYHRHGNYADRIIMTIRLLSKDPEEVRPERLRLQSLGFNECKAMIEELHRRGTVHFRWRFFNDAPLNLPIVGEEIVLIRRQASKALMFRMKVIAEGEDCTPFLEDPEEIHNVDDCSTFVMTNIAGPVIVDINQLNFLDVDSLGKREVYDWLSEEEDLGLRRLFERELCKWMPTNNIDMDPSIDEPKDIKSIADVIEWISQSNYTFYYRDTSAQISGADFLPGTILKAGFKVEVCEKFYKPAQTTRFLIAASHPTAADSDFPAEWRLKTFDRNTLFMVLDDYVPEECGYRQILLVELPEEYIRFNPAELFDAIRNMRAPYPQCVHGNLIPAARSDFDAKLKSSVFPRQRDKELIELMKRPIGGDKKNKRTQRAL